METNNHLNFTGLSSAPAASGPKPTPASGDSPFGPPPAGPPPGKGLNGDTNVNGFSTVCHPSTSGTPGSPPLRAYDCLWDYPPFLPAGGRKAGSPPAPPLGPFPLNGATGGSRPASPGHGPDLRAAGQEFWGNGTPGAMGLNLDSQELYDAFPEQSFELIPNGPDGFYAGEAGAGRGGADAKEMPPAMAENGGGLVGSVELEEAPDLKMCSYNGAAPGAAGPVLAAGSGCLGDVSPIAPRLEDTPILSGDPLEPFESLARDSGLDHTGPEESGGSLELDPPLEPESTEEEEEEDEDEAADSCPETSAAPGAGGEGATPASTAAAGDVPRRRIATPEEVRVPLQHGWRREVRIKRGNHRWQGETWYYGPCGKRMKQFPEVIKYLSRNVVQDVRREHFSFSPRMPVGDFYEERDTLEWVKLSPEEIPSRIQAITGKRGRPRNAEKTKPKEPPAAKRGRGRPPKLKMVDLLSKTDARLLKRLEAQDVLSDEDKLKMSKIKKKMRRKAKNKQKQEARAPRAKEAKKKPKAKEKKGKAEKGKEKVEKGKEKARPKEKKGKGARKADKGLLAQRRLEERRRQQLILEEMKKPTEDMCLGDHQPLPAFSRIPGLVLPSRAFSHCLTVLEFLQSYGKVLGFDPARDVPSLCALQEGLLGGRDSAGELQDLLVRLLRAALCDPGLPPYCQSLKILGEKVSEINLNRDTVSEILRCFLTAYGAGEGLCEGLRTKPFQALPPEQKAAILAFLVTELNGSARIISEIDKTLENMSSYRKNKWIIEGRLRRLKVALAKKTGRPESEITGLEDGRRRRSSRLTEETGLDMEEEEETRGRRSRREEEADTSASSVPELERQIEKLAKRQLFFRKKLLHSSQTLRAAVLGQDRYRRRYWVLPHLGGIFVEGAEEMASGWWWLRDAEELEAVARALHPRGIREKALHKHLTKHREFLREVCGRTPTDPIFHPRPEAAGAAASREALARWSVTDRTYETDLAVLQWVEELEQRVLMADLQIRGWTCPNPDSTRDDLRYCEHKVEPLEDITVRSRRDGQPPRREPTNPLDLAVLRLAALERNVERRYLKEPLWPLHEVVLEKAPPNRPEEPNPTEIAYEITPRVRTWRQTLERCRSAAQVSLCIYQLEKSIAWEKSVNRVTCLVCRRGDDDEHLLLCDGCDRGCHLYCHRPKMTEVPEGDWFCSVCVSRDHPDGDGVARGRVALPGARQPPPGPRLPYSSSAEFAADAALVFDNCRTFNEDDSAVGRAGHAMRSFFQSRWEEFYQGKPPLDP
ncbi:bromodomain adjacent to zinc finger domain protein 2A-like [Columba guinea]|nr:bromodomain adjacent to zinc finger domain protein 2A-like [Columba guinea]